MTFVKINVGDYVFDKAMKVTGVVREISYDLGIADLITDKITGGNGNTNQIEITSVSKLHDLVKVENNEDGSTDEEDEVGLLETIEKVYDYKHKQALEVKNKQQIKIKYFNKESTKLSKITQGDWIDLRAAETVELKAGDFKLIPLGVAMELPEGYEAHVAPRGSTFKNYGVIETNSVGVVDESYKGDNDQWFMPVFALGDTVIPFDERICQFRIVEKMPEVEFEEVEVLGNVDRGSHGSTGVK